MKLHIMKQKLVVCLIIISIVTYLPLPLVHAQIIPINRLSEIEMIIYGQKRDEDLVKRIEKIEKTIYGKLQSGSLMERMDNIVNYVNESINNIPLEFLISTLEWYITGNFYKGSVLNRLDRLEQKIFDKVKDKPLQERVAYLREIVLDEENIPYKKVTLPAETPIRIKLLEKISSAEAKAGDKIYFKVVNNVAIDNKLIIPASVEGYFEVTKVQKAGNLGQDGDLRLNLTDIMTIDGTSIPLAFSTEDKDGKFSRGLALGAGLLGAIVLSNPLGLVISYFVKGQEEVIPAGEEMYVQTVLTKDVTGLEVELP